MAGFERAIVKVLNDQLRAAKVLRANEDNIAKDDVLEGLTAVVAVRLAEPQFEGQTKEVLGTPAASRIVGNVLTKELTSWLTSPPRGEKAAAKALLDKTANAMRARVAARAHRDTQRRKTALESSALPAKLVDCRSDDVERTELFIVEGDSALGTAKTARNADHQALLPIRGKILNVQKSSLADMLKNTECASIIQVIGAGSGRTFDIDQARYGKVILMSDADVDGAHIRCLLLTLIHRYLQAPAGRGPGLRGGPAAAPRRDHQPGQQGERGDLHVLGRGDARRAQGRREARAPGQGAGPALQGPRRDGRVASCARPRWTRRIAPCAASR